MKKPASFIDSANPASIPLPHVCKLGDLIEVLTDYHANGAYEKLKENVELLDHDSYAVMIRTTNFEQNDFVGNCKFITEKAYNFLHKSKVYPGDLIMNKIANAGSIYLMPDIGRPVSLAMNLFLLRIDHTKANPIYVYIYLKINEKYVKNFANGSVTKTITKEAVRNLEIWLPERRTQNNIADLYLCLTNRITLLRETNATLEAIAQALFKSWFVDFDPVHAKQEGREPEGMDSETAALFPDSFEESELGLVPKGWQTKKINEICDLGRGSSPRPIQKFMGGEIPWIKIADATASDGMFVFETKEKIILEGVKNSVPVKPGDLIMSNSASCGITVFVELEGCIHDGWLYFKNYQFVTKNFLFFWLRKIAEHLIHIADGSVQKNLNIALVSSQPILCPKTDIVMAFEKITSPILQRIRENCLQMKSLSSLRDTLLPRLISGQLRLPEAEKLTEEATS